MLIPNLFLNQNSLLQILSKTIWKMIPKLPVVDLSSATLTVDSQGKFFYVLFKHLPDLKILRVPAIFADSSAGSLKTLSDDDVDFLLSAKNLEELDVNTPFTTTAQLEKFSQKALNSYARLQYIPKLLFHVLLNCRTFEK